MRNMRIFLYRTSAEKTSRFSQDRSGTAALEFALISIPTVFMMMAIFFIGFYHFALESLDFSTRQAARLITIGKAPSDVDTADELRARLICPTLFWTFDCNKLVVTSYRIGKTSNLKEQVGGVYEVLDTTTKRLRPPKHAGRLCLGGPTDYILLDVSYAFPTWVPKVLSAATPETVGMRATAFFFNETFKTNRDPGPC